MDQAGSHASPPTPPLRVLVVDGEPHALEGLQRVLRRHTAGRWDLTFALGGEVGARELETSSFDVVVSELGMEGADGLALLDRARELQPEAVRIVLSGDTTPEMALRSVPVAHQFLAKPCESAEVRRVLEGAGRMRSLFTDRRLRRVVTRTGSLPSCPSVYLELTRVLQDPESGAADVASVLERDMGMCAKILQLVNSAFFGLPRELTSLREAVAYLGMDLIRAIATGEQAFRPFQGSGAFGPEELASEPRRALRVGRLAQRIATGRGPTGQALLAGLLHDIGWVVAGGLLPDAYETFQAGRETGTTEEEAFGASHAEIGGYLLGTWGLPLPVVEAAAYHHEPAAAAPDRFEVVTAVHAAAALLGEVDEGHRERAPRLDGELLARLGLGQELDRWRDLAAQSTAPREAA